MTWRTPVFLLCLIGGPFISVGAVTFYRRALQWWYENEIHISADNAEAASWIVMLIVVIVAAVGLGFGSIDGHYFWEKKK